MIHAVNDPACLVVHVLGCCSVSDKTLRRDTLQFWNDRKVTGHGDHITALRNAIAKFNEAVRRTSAYAYHLQESHKWKVDVNQPVSEKSLQVAQYAIYDRLNGDDRHSVILTARILLQHMISVMKKVKQQARLDAVKVDQYLCSLERFIAFRDGDGQSMYKLQCVSALSTAVTWDLRIDS